MFRFLQKIGRIILRVLTGEDRSAIAILVTTLATDFIRSWLAKNPGAVLHASTVVQIVEAIARIAGVSTAVADRAVTSAIQQAGMRTSDNRVGYAPPSQ